MIGPLATAGLHGLFPFENRQREVERGENGVG